MTSAEVTMTAEAVPAEPTSRRTRGWAALGLAVLMVQRVFYVFGAVSDLTSDASAGLPTDHTGTFTALVRHLISQHPGLYARHHALHHPARTRLCPARIDLRPAVPGAARDSLPPAPAVGLVGGVDPVEYFSYRRLA